MFAPRVLILLYHRVAELPLDPQLLAVTPWHFREHLEILRQYGPPMRLQRLVEALRDGNLPDRAVVVTFDDGYADNLYSAKPLLEHYNIPATVFVTTGYLGLEREFWWDELDRLLLQPGRLPDALRLNVNGSIYQWELSEAAYYSEDTYQCHRWWNVLRQDDPCVRQRIYRSLCHLLRPLPGKDRRKVLKGLLAWAGAESTVRPTHRTLSPDEVSRLAEGGLVEVSAHTVSHPVLSVLSAAAQRDEIGGSKARLEEILGRPVMSFAYPYGSRLHYAAETVGLVREAGFSCACSGHADAVRHDTDLFQLPRATVRDWDGEEFFRRLEEWFR